MLNYIYIILPEPFVVAFVETTYTVIESEEQVEVCVNLTRPPQDILDETVRVNVFNNESSVYIPESAEIASMLMVYTLINSRRACAARVTIVDVCLSLNQRLVSRGSFHPENHIMYSTRKEGQNICGVFSETVSLRRSSTPSIVWPAYSAKVHTAWV